MIDPVELAARMIRIPSLSGQEDRVADLVETSFTELGYDHVFRDRLGSVVGVFGPEDSEVKLLFDGHMDVVPAAGIWNVDPFGAEEIDGRLFGRGAADMKGGLAAAICGVAQAARSGRLCHRVVVSASVLEETIEGVALGEVMDRVRPSAVVICEPSDMKLQLGQRGRIELLLEIAGVPCHAAYPGAGVNPIELAAEALQNLRHLIPPLDPDLGAGILVPTDIITMPYPAISMVPAGARIRFDRRLLPGETLASVISIIEGYFPAAERSRFDLHVTAEPVTAYTQVAMSPARFLAAWKSDRQHPLALTAIQAIAAAGQELRIGSYGFCTNGSESAGRRNVPTIGFGPGAEEHAHIADEFVMIDEIRQAARVYECLCLKAAGDLDA